VVFDRLTTQQTAALTLPFQDIFTIKLRDLMTSRDDLNRSPVGMRRVNRCAAFQAGCLDVGTAFHEQLHDFRSSEKRGGEPIEQQHEIQLACYASMFRELTGDLEHGLEIRSLVKTKTPRVDVHRYERRSQRHMARLFAVIREYLRAIDLGEFHYRPGFNCMFCDVRQPCIEWDAGGNQAAAF